MCLCTWTIFKCPEDDLVGAVPCKQRDCHEYQPCTSEIDKFVPESLLWFDLMAIMSEAKKFE